MKPERITRNVSTIQVQLVKPEKIVIYQFFIDLNRFLGLKNR